MIDTILLRPGAEHLPAYAAALARGWSPDNMRPETAQDELAAIDADPDGLLATFEDIEGRGPEVILPDGRAVPRIPGIRRFIWDGGFCGIISLRWLPGTPDLPPHVPGHVGYTVVPWKEGRGLATRALSAIVELAPGYGLDRVDLHCDANNAASIRVIEKNGGRPRRDIPASDDERWFTIPV